MERKFVILAHSGSGPLHYDMLLETAEMLPTWQFAALPTDMAIGEELPCRRIQDHRAIYLTYEGPISRNRGQVKRVAQGRLELLDSSDVRWVVRLAGEKVAGKFELIRQANSDDWIFHRLA